MNRADTLAADARAWSFAELVHEGLSLIPAHAPHWTDHNPSDPGITLIELLAYYSEILAYRALRVTPDARLNFLRLLDGQSQAHPSLEGGPPKDLDAAIRQRIAELAQDGCAATPADVERLAVAAAQRILGQPGNPGAVTVRSVCITGDELLHLRAGRPVDPQAAGDMCVVLAPEAALSTERMATLCREVQGELAPRCLLTSRVQVTAPVTLQVGVGGRIALRDGFSAAEVLDDIDAALRERFQPVFGRAVHLSEIAEVIDLQEGVDFVEDLAVHRLGTSAWDEGGLTMGVRPGVYATLGRDARFGGGAGRHAVRMVRGADGEASTVLPRAWEIADVRLLRDKIDLRAGGDHEG